MNWIIVVIFKIVFFEINGPFQIMNGIYMVLGLSCFTIIFNDPILACIQDGVISKQRKEIIKTYSLKPNIKFKVKGHWTSNFQYRFSACFVIFRHN